MSTLRGLVLAFVFAVPTLACASSEYGFVDWVGIRASDGLIIFSLTTRGNPNFPPSTRTAKPPCATQGYWVIKDENSATGQRQYDAVMRAKAANLTMVVVGSATCTRWPDGEDADLIQVDTLFL